MSLNIQVFEEYGPVVNGRGTVVEAANFNWKSTSDITGEYYFYPLRRPLLKRDQTFSYQRYFFFKISGTYTYLKDVKLNVTIGDSTTQPSSRQASGSIAEGKYSKSDQDMLNQWFYRFTNVYEEPNNQYDGRMTYAYNHIKSLQRDFDWMPNLSTVGPTSATERPIVLTGNNDYYTQYLVTQMRVLEGDWDNIGNTDELKFTLSLNEFE